MRRLRAAESCSQSCAKFETVFLMISRTGNCRSRCRVRLLDQDLRSGIDVTGRFIEDQHRRVFGHGSCNRNKLFLTGGESALFLDLGIKSLRQGRYVVAEVGLFENSLQSVLVDILKVVDNVLSERAVDDPGFLQDCFAFMFEKSNLNITSSFSVNIFWMCDDKVKSSHHNS